MSSRKSHNHAPKKPKQVRTKVDVASFNFSSGAYVCLLCEERHDQIPKEWAPWEFPRHLEKEHGYPEEAHVLRMKLIPNWNESFEKEYLKNLEKEIKYKLPDSEPEPIEIDPLSNRFKKEDEQNKKEEQEAASDNY
jgi:hypothetical protein